MLVQHKIPKGCSSNTAKDTGPRIAFSKALTTVLCSRSQLHGAGPQLFQFGFASINFMTFGNPIQNASEVMAELTGSGALHVCRDYEMNNSALTLKCLASLRTWARVRFRSPRRSIAPRLRLAQFTVGLGNVSIPGKAAGLSGCSFHCSSFHRSLLYASPPCASTAFRREFRGN